MKDMKKLILTAAAIVMACASFSSCEKEFTKADPTAVTVVCPVHVDLPANYSEAGVNVTIPEAVLRQISLTADSFTSGFGQNVQFGWASSADPSAVKWESENNDGKYGHWFDLQGKATSTSKAIHSQSNCQWGKSSSNVTSFNINMNKENYTQGASAKCYQAVGSTKDGVTDILFIEWDVLVKEEKPFATGSASFSMTTGIVAGIKMIQTTASEEYATLEIDMPAAVYQTVKAMSGYDALAYFISSGQVKSYAFPKAAAVGAAGTDFWFDNTGSVAAESAAVVNASLDLEPGNPIVGGGKTVKLVLKPKVGATLTTGTKFNCGFIFVYGTTKIPLIASITVVDSL